MESLKSTLEAATLYIVPYAQYATIQVGEIRNNFTDGEWLCILFGTLLVVDIVNFLRCDHIRLVHRDIETLHVSYCGFGPAVGIRRKVNMWIKVESCHMCIEG